METKKYNYFVADEGDGMYNVFAYADFDEDGFLIGHEDEDGYHYSDFDIVEWFDSFEEACDWIDKHSV